MLDAGNVTFELVEGEDSPVAVVSLRRPGSRNAQTPATWRALVHIAENVPSHVRAIILAGEGESFSAGLDRRMFGEGIEGEIALPDMASMSDAEFSSAIEVYQSAFVLWRQIPQVVVAAVQGHAIGAGFQLALGADLIVASSDVKFSMKEPQLGLVPDLGGTKPLVDKVGYSAALEICLTGRIVESEEALSRGIAHKIVDPSVLLDEAISFSKSLFTPLPNAQFATKKLLMSYSSIGAAEQQERERNTQVGRIRELAALLGKS